MARGHVDDVAQSEVDLTCPRKNDQGTDLTFDYLAALPHFVHRGEDDFRYAFFEGSFQ